MRRLRRAGLSRGIISLGTTCRASMGMRLGEGVLRR